MLTFIVGCVCLQCKSNLHRECKLNCFGEFASMLLLFAGTVYLFEEIVYVKIELFKSAVAVIVLSLVGISESFANTTVLWIDTGLSDPSDVPAAQVERKRILKELESKSRMKVEDFRSVLIQARSHLELYEKLLGLDAGLRFTHAFVDAHGSLGGMQFSDDRMSDGSPRGQFFAKDESQSSEVRNDALSVFSGLEGHWAENAKVVFRTCHLFTGTEIEARNRAIAIQKAFRLRYGSIYGNSVQGALYFLPCGSESMAWLGSGLHKFWLKCRRSESQYNHGYWFNFSESRGVDMQEMSFDEAERRFVDLDESHF